MLSILIDGIRFNVRAAALIVDDDHILLHRAAGCEIWALPGGRVEPGEMASDAIVRELEEEIGEAVECQGLAFTVENFFDWEGVPNHEIGFYWRVVLPLASRLLNKAKSHMGCEPGTTLEYRWFRLSELATVALFPEFLRSANLARDVAPRHIVQGTAPLSCAKSLAR